MIDDGGPAFPVPPDHVSMTGNPGDGMAVCAAGTGMTLRDWFAGMALPSLLTILGEFDKKAAEAKVQSAQISWHEVVKVTDADSIAPNYDAAVFGAYRIADAMIAARKENQ